MDFDNDAGWLAGFFDGEGNVDTKGVSFSQNEGKILNKTLNLLSRKNFPVSISDRTRKGRRCVTATICSISECLRFLGSIKPDRLTEKISKIIEGRRYPRGQLAVVESITPIGMGKTIAIETDTNTFIAEGLFSHNSQLSQRYVNESEANMIVPKVIMDSDEAMIVWDSSIRQSQAAYEGILHILKQEEATKTLDIKTRRGAARSVLPNATETMIFCTANARAIRHFIEMRATPYADAEIRAVAIQLLKLMQTEAPNIFNDYKIITLEDGSEVAETDTIKV